MKSVENNFDNPKVNELLKKHFIELRSVSPEGSTHVLDIHGLKIPSIKFWSLWENENLVGCGALKLLDEKHGEFKSIRIAEKFRGKGLGIKIINYLMKIKCKKIILGCTELPIAIFAYKSLKKIKESKVFIDPNLLVANVSMKKYKSW